MLAYLPAWLTGPDAGLFGLFLTSLLAATLLPVSSEVVLFGFLSLHPEHLLAALALATLGNTLGGLTTFACGRALPEKSDNSRLPLAGVRRWGPPALLFSWLPLVGDTLCLAAGWLRLHWLPCTVCMALGKAGRYWLVAQGASIFS